MMELRSHSERHLGQRLLPGLCVIAVILVLFNPWGGSKEAPVAGTAHPHPQVRALLGELRGLRGTWEPRQREEHLARLTAEPGRWIPAVALLLESPRHPFVPDGLALLGEFGNETARSLARTQALEGHPTLRAAAILAVHKIQPWSAEELDRLLADGEPRVLAAALAVASGSLERDVQMALIRVAAQGPVKVRGAAVQGLGDPLDPGVAEAMRGLLLTGDGDTRRALLGDLSRGCIAEALRPGLGALLWSPDPEVVRAGLQGMLSLPFLEDGLPGVWGVARDEEQDAPLRMLALRVMERHGIPDPIGLEGIAVGGPLRVRYGAVRVLLAHGLAAGPDAALHLIEDARDLPAETDTAADVARETTRILAHAYGARSIPTLERLRQAVAEAPLGPVSLLPAVPLR